MFDAAGQRYNRPLVSLSVVIPAYNEEKRLPATLDIVDQYLRARQFAFAEVIVVDDGSADSTAMLVERFARNNPAVRLVKNPGNRGKGYAVKNGMLSARGEWCLFSDADLSSPIQEFERLHKAALAGSAAVAIGSRAVQGAEVTVHQSSFREWSGRLFNLVMRTVTGLPFHDTQCGFKLFRGDAAKEIFQRQLLDGFSFDVEDLVIAQGLGLKAIEVPVQWANVEGTKVSMGHGLKSFADLLEIRRNRAEGKYR